MPKRAAFCYLGCLFLVLLTGCSTVQDLLPDRRAEYKRSETGTDLAVPPDLTSSSIDDNLIVPELGPAGTATFSDYSRERGEGGKTNTDLLPQPETVRMEREGTFRWLVIAGDSETVWNEMRRFWEDNGFLLEREDPGTGIMETQWAENRADIPEGPVRSLLGKALDGMYSASTRDKFKLRIEPGQEPDTTSVFLTHYGVKEVQRGEYEVVWENRPRDPELEAEMLRRIMLFVGVSEERATALAQGHEPEAGPRARMMVSPQGQRQLLIQESVAMSWRLVGIALDGSYFQVEERDPALRTFTVRYRDPLADSKSEGILSSLAFWKDEPDEALYEVQLSPGQGRETMVTVLDDEGRQSSSEATEKILLSLEDQLR